MVRCGFKPTFNTFSLIKWGCSVLKCLWEIRLLWLHLLLLMPFARIHCAWIKTTNQSQEEYLTECQSLLLHTLRAAQLPCACKQKKTKEKQANKKELDWATPWGEGLWRQAGAQWWRMGRDIEVVFVQIFKPNLFSILPTSALTLEL